MSKNRDERAMSEFVSAGVFQDDYDPSLQAHRNSVNEGRSPSRKSSSRKRSGSSAAPASSDNKIEPNERVSIVENDNSGSMKSRSDDTESDHSPTNSFAGDLAQRRYSISELVSCLGKDEDISSLPPELERRVLDFRVAQQKRVEKYGRAKKWGIFGMYAHLASVRTDLEWAEDAAWRRHHGEPYLSWSDFDDIRKTGINRPWFTYSLVFICSIMMIVEFGVNDWKVEPLDVNPMIGPSAQTLVDVGARDTPLIVDDGQWWRLFSPLILHAGLIHYFINMAALWFIGGAVEQSHGVLNAIVLFLIPGVGGNILSAIFLPQYISVGASGGIFGLIGGCLADITVNWNILFIKESEDDTITWKRNFWAIFFIAAEIVVNILLGLTPFIDNFTHLGGLIYGLLCGWSTIDPVAVSFFGYQGDFWTNMRQITIKFFGIIASVICIMVTTIWLATSDVGDSPCPNCRYFSCVPILNWHCDDCDFVVATLFKDNGSYYYTRIELVCPDKVIESIDVSNELITSPAAISEKLPGYCRDYCDELFSD